MTANRIVAIAAQGDHCDTAIWMKLSSFGLSHGIWRGGRVVECTGLENQQGFTPFGGSNPPLSAMRLTNVTDQKNYQHLFFPTL